MTEALTRLLAYLREIGSQSVSVWGRYPSFGCQWCPLKRVWSDGKPIVQATSKYIFIHVADISPKRFSQDGAPKVHEATFQAGCSDWLVLPPTGRLPHTWVFTYRCSHLTFTTKVKNAVCFMVAKGLDSLPHRGRSHASNLHRRPLLRRNFRHVPQLGS